MSGPEISVRTRSADSALVVTVVGEVDAATAPELKSTIDETIQRGTPLLVVDLSGVEFFGSAGLSALMTAVASDRVHELRVVASAAARRPIEITGLDQEMTLFDTLAAALSAKRAAS